MVSASRLSTSISEPSIRAVAESSCQLCVLFSTVVFRSDDGTVGESFLLEMAFTDSQQNWFHDKEFIAIYFSIQYTSSLFIFWAIIKSTALQMDCQQRNLYSSLFQWCLFSVDFAQPLKMAKLWLIFWLKYLFFLAKLKRSSNYLTIALTLTTFRIHNNIN